MAGNELPSLPARPGTIRVGWLPGHLSTRTPSLLKLRAVDLNLAADFNLGGLSFATWRSRMPITRPRRSLAPPPPGCTAAFRKRLAPAPRKRLAPAPRGSWMGDETSAPGRVHLRWSDAGGWVNLALYVRPCGVQWAPCRPRDHRGCWLSVCFSWRAPLAAVWSVSESTTLGRSSRSATAVKAR